MIVFARLRNPLTGWTMDRALVAAPDEPAGYAWDEVDAGTDFPPHIARERCASLDPRWGACVIPKPPPPKKGP